MNSLTSTGKFSFEKLQYQLFLRNPVTIFVEHSKHQTPHTVNKSRNSLFDYFIYRLINTKKSVSRYYWMMLFLYINK